MPNFLIYSDGGSRGNPGPAAYGFTIKSENPKFEVRNSKFIGVATNNQAEYQGVLAALKFLKSEINLKLQLSKDSIIEVKCFLDSQLIVEQMLGRYKIKNEGLKPLYWEIRELIMELGGNVKFEHIPREKNKEADKLVNEAIDKSLLSS